MRKLWVAILSAVVLASCGGDSAPAASGVVGPMAPTTTIADETQVQAVTKLLTLPVIWDRIEAELNAGSGTHDKFLVAARETLPKMHDLLTAAQPSVAVLDDAFNTAHVDSSVAALSATLRSFFINYSDSYNYRTSVYEALSANDSTTFQSLLKSPLADKTNAVDDTLMCAYFAIVLATWETRLPADRFEILKSGSVGRSCG